MNDFVFFIKLQEKLFANLPNASYQLRLKLRISKNDAQE